MTEHSKAAGLEQGACLTLGNLITPKDEIEVTEAMVAAGLDEMRDHHYESDTKWMLECIFRAMLYASPAASETRSDK
jgi:hypothetical protein